MKAAPSSLAEGSMLDQILQGAEQAFLASGYDLATMDLVARHARVARGSVYNHFASKEDLFLAMMRRGIDRFVETAILERESDLTPLERLRHVVTGFLREASQPYAVEMYRIVVAQAGRFPELAVTLHQRGLAQVQDRIRQLAQDLGPEVIADPDQFADSLLSMVMGGYFARRLLKLPSTAEYPSLQAYVDGAIEALLKRRN